MIHDLKRYCMIFKALIINLTLLFSSMIICYEYDFPFEIYLAPIGYYDGDYPVSRGQDSSINLHVPNYVPLVGFSQKKLTGGSHLR